MLTAERQRVNTESKYRETELQRKQLQFFLDSLNSYNTQATLVTGFAFTAFSADALHELPYKGAPVRSLLFACLSAAAMGSAVSTVVISNYLMIRVERLAMNRSTSTALAALRQRMGTVQCCYMFLLAALIGAASTLLFAMCDITDEDLACERVGASVLGVFAACVLVASTVVWRMRGQFDRYRDACGGLHHRSYLIDTPAGTPAEGDECAAVEHSVASIGE